MVGGGGSGAKMDVAPEVNSVNSAFDGLLSKDYNPGYFISPKINPATLDVNIQPTKTEIKFEDEHSLYAILRSSIKHSLGIFQVMPSIDFDRDQTMDPPYAYKEKTPSNPTISVDSSFNPFKFEKKSYSLESNSKYAKIESIKCVKSEALTLHAFSIICIPSAYLLHYIYNKIQCLRFA